MEKLLPATFLIGALSIVSLITLICVEGVKVYPPDNKKIKMTVVYKPRNCNKNNTCEEADTCYNDYVGYFRNGKKFDSTFDRHEAMKFTLGLGEIIKGAEDDARGMCVGEIHHTEIPPSIAYGDKDYGQIPAGSWLVFDTLMTKVEKQTSFDLSNGGDIWNMPLFT